MVFRVLPPTESLPIFCYVTKSPSESPSDPGHITRHIVCHIVYDIVYDVVYDIVYDIIYDILCCPPVLTVVWQDTLCLVAPYPFRMEPLEDFDPLTDFDMTCGDGCLVCSATTILLVQPVPHWPDGEQVLPQGGFSGVLQHI